MKKLNKNNGITLIALVVTIIVLLILAGISITMLTGQNGILNRATEAREKIKSAGNEESVKIAVMGSFDAGEKLTADKTIKNIENEVSGSTVYGEDFPIVVNVEKESYIVNSDGSIEKFPGTVNIKIGDKTETITREEAPNYYGKIVSNYTQKGTTYRLFYIDFDGMFGMPGTAYIIADYTTEPGLINKYKTYESKDTSVMKRLNPLWAKEKPILENNNEKIVSALCDTTLWKDYANDNANYAVAGPSIEMYVESYKQTKKDVNYKLRALVNGYEFSNSNGKDWFPSAINYFTTDNNSIYLTEQGTFWLTSIPTSNTACLDAANYDKKGINNEGYGESNGFRPIVSIKKSFTLELQ